MMTVTGEAYTAPTTRIDMTVGVGHLRMRDHMNHSANHPLGPRFFVAEQGKGPPLLFPRPEGGVFLLFPLWFPIQSTD